MTLPMSDKLNTSSVTLFIAHHLWHDKVKPPTWHGKAYGALILTTVLSPVRLCCACCHVCTTMAIAHQQFGTGTQHSNFIINFDVSLISNNSDIPPFGSSFSRSLHQRMNLSTSSKFTASRCWCHQHAHWSKTFSCRNLLFLHV